MRTQFGCLINFILAFATREHRGKFESWS
jgi:hypothetical protein